MLIRTKCKVDGDRGYVLEAGKDATVPFMTHVATNRCNTCCMNVGCSDYMYSPRTKAITYDKRPFLKSESCFSLEKKLFTQASLFKEGRSSYVMALVTLILQTWISLKHLQRKQGSTNS